MLVFYQMASAILMALFLIIIFLMASSCASAAETNKLDITLMEPSEGQPHITVNDFAWIADAFIFPMLAGYPANASPVVNNATNGDMYIVPSRIDNATPEDDWADHDNELAVLRNDEWNFFEPAAGWTVYSAAYAFSLTYNGSTWGAQPRSWNKQTIIADDTDNVASFISIGYDLIINTDGGWFPMTIRGPGAIAFFDFLIDAGDPEIWMQRSSDELMGMKLDTNGDSFFNGGNTAFGHAYPDSIIDASGAITLRARPSTPSDPDTGASVLWMDSSGNLRWKTNPAGVVKEATIVTFSGL